MKKGKWEWRGFVVCAFHSAAWSMGWLGSKVATWTPREGPNSYPTNNAAVAVVDVVVDVFIVMVVVF